MQFFKDLIRKWKIGKETPHSFITRHLKSMGETPADVSKFLYEGKYFGVCRSSFHCPVSYYLTDLLPETPLVCVSGYSYSIISFKDNSEGKIISRGSLPAPVSDFVRMFDDHLFPENIK
jgi:hypothetical protein